MLWSIKDYKDKLDYIETERYIKFVKDHFEDSLASELGLIRVSAPLFLRKNSGLNDDLNGIERPVKFDAKNVEDELEVVQSLAKWKRSALKKYDFKNMGIYTDMNAIRRDEIVDNIHSFYVDQWDWEKVIAKKDRNVDTFKDYVIRIIRALKNTEQALIKECPKLDSFIEEEVTFITSQDLEDMYPDLDAKAREQVFTKEHKTVCIMQIGDVLKGGKPHDLRAPDYDDWSLNGDILIYDPIVDKAIEISSMGIRVDKEALLSQLKKARVEERLSLPYHQDLINGRLPQTIGGGIGQSRICLILLNKAHVGEVQASVWPKGMYDECKDAGIHLL